MLLTTVQKKDAPVRVLAKISDDALIDRRAHRVRGHRPHPARGRREPPDERVPALQPGVPPELAPEGVLRHVQ